MCAVASRSCAHLRSRPSEATVFHPTLFKTKHFTNLFSADQHGSHCLQLPVQLVLPQGVWIKGQVLPALSGKMSVATGLPGAHESTRTQPWRSALSGYSCIMHSVTGGWMKCGRSHLLGGTTEADMSFQEGSFAPASLNPSKCSASGCC